MMINTPVKVCLIENCNVLTESDGTHIGDFITTGLAYESAKRINMHDELVAAVNELIPSFIHDSWTEEEGERIMYFYELLERCK